MVHCRAGHPWERLEVHAFVHPYAMVTDVSGAFEFLDVPPGRYELNVHHYGFPTESSASGRPSLGEPLAARHAVSLEAGGEVEVDIDLSLPPEVALAPARARR